MVKYLIIYLFLEEFEVVQNMVFIVECVFKYVLDWLDEINKGIKIEGEIEVKKDEVGENYFKD